MTTVTLDDDLSLDELLAVAHGAQVALGPAARDRIAAGRAVVDKALADDAAVYGLTTQVGHGRDQRLTEEQLRGQQQMLVMTHAGGFGPPLPAVVVRAAIAARLAGIARGGSGASLAAAGTLAALLNAEVHPLVPSTASVGAGDLGQMAMIAQVAIGAGRAEFQGETLAGGEALARAGIAPLALEAKDGLALLSANGIAIGQGALVVAAAERAAAAADLAAVLSLEATDGNPSIVHPAVAAAKPYPGLAAAAAHLRELLAGSRLLDGAPPASVQDPLSFRVVPQVHGALREFAAAARHAVEMELNSSSDNPLAVPEEGALVSNGNFHPIVLAIAFDALRVAIAHVGQLSERRMSHLWDAFFRHLQAAGPPPARMMAGLQLRYPAAAAFPELKQLAAPATLDVPVLDLGVEDHGTSAPLSVDKTRRALEVLGDVLAIELLLAADVLAVLPERPEVGEGATRALALTTAAVGEAADPAAAHAALRQVFPEGGAR